MYMLEEFGSPEAIWELEANEFPAVVTMDSHGESLQGRPLTERGGLGRPALSWAVTG